jgi:HD-GYP domain-containing protein (c-di-GMP phosphodiesterase class II)
MDDRLILVLGIAAGALAVRARHARRVTERYLGATLETLLNAIDANDAETGQHVRRVASYAAILADSIGLDEREQREIERVALFHDIGKIHRALMDVIRDPHRLSPSEFEEILAHPGRGAAVLRPLANFDPGLSAGVMAHHERWDGSGYPNGLRGKRIPLSARIVAIADTFDAVAHDRRYRKGGGPVAGARVLAEGRGTQFDPELVDLVLFPPVFERFERAHVRAHRLNAANRRVGHGLEHVPDVTFRWRSASPASAPGRE